MASTNQPNPSSEDQLNAEIEQVFGRARGATRIYRRLDGSFSIAIEKTRESEFRAFLRKRKATDSFIIAD